MLAFIEKHVIRKISVRCDVLSNPNINVVSVPCAMIYAMIFRKKSAPIKISHLMFVTAAIN